MSSQFDVFVFVWGVIVFHLCIVIGSDRNQQQEVSSWDYK